MPSEAVADEEERARMEKLAHVFGFISSQCGLLAFLSGRRALCSLREPALQAATTLDTIRDAERRGEGLLESVFGNSPHGLALRAYVVAVDTTSGLRRLVSDRDWSKYTPVLCVQQLKALRLCTEKVGIQSCSNLPVKLNRITEVLKQALATIFLNNVRGVQEDLVIQALVRASRRQRRSCMFLPANVARTVKLAEEAEGMAMLNKKEVREKILQDCREFSEDRLRESINNLIDYLSINESWIERMKELDGALKCEAAVLSNAKHPGWKKYLRGGKLWGLTIRSDYHLRRSERQGKEGENERSDEIEPSDLKRRRHNDGERSAVLSKLRSKRRRTVRMASSRKLMQQRGVNGVPTLSQTEKRCVHEHKWSGNKENAMIRACPGVCKNAVSGELVVHGSSVNNLGIADERRPSNSFAPVANSSQSHSGGLKHKPRKLRD